MSKGLICDHCGEMLPLDHNGREALSGEDAAWIVIQIANEKLDVCSRACAIALLNSESVVAAHDAYQETIMAIARNVSGEAES